MKIKRYLKSINVLYPQIELCGVDISESQIQQAKKYLSEQKNISLFVKDGLHLPFPDKHFDMAITYGCFSAVKKKNLNLFFSEIVRTTKSKGIFIEYQTSMVWNVFKDKHYWYSHKYDRLFKDFQYSVKTINEIGDSLFIVEL